MLLVMALLLSFSLPLTAAAKDDVKVSVSYDMEELVSSDITDGGILVDAVDSNEFQNELTRTVRDLSNGAVNINWNINAEKSLRSQYNYKTNSQKIKLKMKASPSSTSLTVQLYNSSGTRVATKTVSVGTILNTTITFSNLTASTNYYFRVINNDQHDVALSGSVYQ